MWSAPGYSSGSTPTPSAASCAARLRVHAAGTASSASPCDEHDRRGAGGPPGGLALEGRRPGSVRKPSARTQRARVATEHLHEAAEPVGPQVIAAGDRRRGEHVGHVDRFRRPATSPPAARGTRPCRASSRSGPSPRRGRRPATSARRGGRRGPRLPSPAASSLAHSTANPPAECPARATTVRRPTWSGRRPRARRVEHRVPGRRAVQVRVDRPLHAEPGEVGRDHDGAVTRRGRRRTTRRARCATARTRSPRRPAPCTHTTTGRGRGARPAGTASAIDAATGRPAASSVR